VALGVKTFFCIWTVLMALAFGHCDRLMVAIKHPAAAHDLRMFYRSIQALSADSILNETATLVV